MPYCTVEQVRQAVARDLADDDGTGSSLTNDVISRYIDEADREIDSKLVSLYQTPFNPVPPLISTISVAIAAYLGDLTYREVRDYQSDLNPILLRYKRAQELLKALANGSADLPGAEPSTDPSGEGQIVAAISDGALFCPGHDTDLRQYHNPNRGAAVADWDRW